MFLSKRSDGVYYIWFYDESGKKRKVRPKTQRAFLTAFREFSRVIGYKPIRFVSVRDIEQFLSVKKGEASERTAGMYFVTLASAFQAAVRWKYLNFNPFRRVEKPKLPRN